ncbi:ATP-binding protein [uncultured Polaribacter sp.]
MPNETKEVIEEICAFSNASGGTLILGVDDANNI